MTQPCLTRRALLAPTLTATQGPAVPAAAAAGPLPLAPANTATVDGVGNVLLRGADVVAYFTDGRHIQGTPQYRSTVDGVTLFFRQRREQGPLRRGTGPLPAAVRRLLRQRHRLRHPLGGDADTWRIIDGKLYIFGGAFSRDAFMLDAPGNLAHARRYWTEEVSGSNAVVQRYKRLVFRVPHYKTSEQLSAELATARK